MGRISYTLSLSLPLSLPPSLWFDSPLHSELSTRPTTQNHPPGPQVNLQPTTTHELAGEHASYKLTPLLVSVFLFSFSS